MKVALFGTSIFSNNLYTILKKVYSYMVMNYIDVLQVDSYII